MTVTVTPKRTYEKPTLRKSPVQLQAATAMTVITGLRVNPNDT